jgi:hypothetical protein
MLLFQVKSRQHQLMQQSSSSSLLLLLLLLLLGCETICPVPPA